MKKKKITAIILCICITLPTFCIGAVSFAKTNPDIIDLSFLKSAPAPKTNVSNGVQTMESVAENLEGKVISIKVPDTGKEEVYKGTKKTVIVDGTKQLKSIKSAGANDLYNLDQKDVEELLNSGYSIKQIFEADEIGNSICENPKNLLERAKKEEIDLKDIEKKVIAERKQKRFDELKVKYSKEYLELKKEQLNDNSISTLLAFYDQNDVKSIHELVGQYKKDGDKALVKAVKAKEPMLSKDKMNKYGLASSDNEGLSDELISKMEELSRQTNKPVKELIKGFKEAQEKAGGSK